MSECNSKSYCKVVQATLLGLTLGGGLFIQASAQAPVFNEVQLSAGQTGDVTVDWVDGGSGAGGVQIGGAGNDDIELIGPDASDVLSYDIYVTDLFSGNEVLCTSTATTIAPNTNVFCNAGAPPHTLLNVFNTAGQPLGDLTNYARFRVVVDPDAEIDDIDGGLAQVYGGWQTFDPLGGDIDDGTVTGDIVLLAGPQPELSVDPTDIPFGNVRTDTTSSEMPIEICNVGEDGSELTVSNIDVSPAQFNEGAGSTCLDTAFTLGQNECCNFHVTFTPDADGGFNGTVDIETSAGNESVTLSGTGTPSDAALQIAPDNYDFPDQDILAGPVCTNFTLSNTPGDDSLTIGTVTVAAPFTVTANCNGAMLGGGESCVVEACFDPDAEGDFAETLSATSDAGNVSAALTGTGTAEADVTFNPPFGDVSLGTGAPGDTLSAGGSVTNTGSADADVECTLNDMTGVFSTDPSPLAGLIPADGGSVDFTLFCDLPADAEEGAEYEAELNCSVDGTPAGTHNLSCGVSTFQAIPVPTMQNWALALFALMMLLIGGISIRFFRAS